MQKGIKNLILVGGDIVLLYAALWLTLLIRYQQLPDMALWNQHLMPFSLLFLVWLVIFYINGLYDLATSNNDISFYNRILTTLLLSFAIAAAYFYLLTDRLFDIKPRAVFFIYIALVGVSIPLWRYWYNTFIQRPSLLRNVLVVGMNDEAKELIKEIIKKPQLGYRIKAILHDGYTGNPEFTEVEIYNSRTDLKQLLPAKNIGTVVTVLDPRSNPALVRQLYQTLKLKPQFFDLPTFYEKLTGKVPVTNIGHIWFLENLAEAEKGVYELFKRIFDFAVALLLFLVTLPFMPFVAVAIKLDSPGPVFFRQMRAGHLGKPFQAIKFRSMVAGAEKAGQPQWAQKNDPRVTRVGRVLRKTRLDEIPQLLNIFRGELSLIGPRPERPEFVAQLEKIIPFYNERHLIKPGMTGWAQINFPYAASTGDALKKLQYDLFYIKNRSLALDLGIALKTIKLMITGRGQ